MENERENEREKKLKMKNEEIEKERKNPNEERERKVLFPFTLLFRESFLSRRAMPSLFASLSAITERLPNDKLKRCNPRALSYLVYDQRVSLSYIQLT